MKTKRRNFSSSSCFHFHHNKEQHQNRGDHPQSFVKLQNSSDHQMRASSHNNRTLLDIIRDEESGNAYKDLVDKYTNTKNQHHYRKSIKDRLRIRRSSSAKTTSASSCSSSVCSANLVNSPLMAGSSQPVPASDIPLPSKPQFGRAQSSVSFRSSSRRDWNPKLEVDDHDVEEEKTEQSPVVPPKLSAMSFRSCSRRDWNPKVEVKDDDDDDDDHDEEQETEQSGEEEDDKDDEEDHGDHEDTEKAAVEENVKHEEEEPKKGNFLPSLPKDQPPTPPPSVTVSLLDLLLEETDTQAAYIGKDEEEEEEEEEEEIRKPEVVEGDWEDWSGVYACCVCMVRHKGAAFIPCGHTFCRKCSRELWASRGNCPLCNGYILEILNIF